MTIRLSLTLALCLAAPLACKKTETTPPDDAKADGGGGGGDDDAGGGGGGGSGDASEEILTVDAFEEYMQGKQGDVADCFAQAKEANKSLSGKLVLDITVGGDGAVSAVKFDDASTIKEASVTACVEEKAKGWKFPKTRDGNPMTLPYSLNLS